MFGGEANPLSGVLPTAFGTLKLRKFHDLALAFFQPRHDDPALQVCLLVSMGGQDVSQKGDDLLIGNNLASCVRKGVDAAANDADLAFHVWTTAFTMCWDMTDLTFCESVELEHFVPVELAEKVRCVGADSRWFGLQAVDHGHVQRLELV
mmetsp:Transcript_24099/g.59901  ORF Transcript_24099/g.59901 Transcript_24099/m.59901 type:complete len:150 (+) Transcript_24099:821-1270(+)